MTADQFVITLVVEALDRRERPQSEAEIRVVRASLFAAKTIARDLSAVGSKKNVKEIRDFMSTIVPDPDTALSTYIGNIPKPTAAE